MADTLILSDGRLGAGSQGEGRQAVWISTTTGYFFHNDDGNAVNYTKTTDGGVTWDPAIEIDDTGNRGGEIALWYDKWTPDDTGTKIHVAIRPRVSGSVRYISVDTDGDIVSTPVTIDAFGNDSTLIFGELTIVKAKNGNLYCGGGTGPPQLKFKRSVDGGTTWTSSAQLYEVSTDAAFLAPGSNVADPADVQAIYADFATGPSAITLKVYDNSANSWSESATIFVMHRQVKNASPPTVALSIRLSDEHLIAVFIADDVFPGTNHDIRVFDMNGIGSIVEKTNVVTVQPGIQNNGVALGIDQNNDDLYVFYTKGAGNTDVVFKKSTDGGTTWGTEQVYSQTNRNYSALTVDISIDSRGGLFAPIMWENTGGANDDVWFNGDNAVMVGGPPAPRTRTQIGWGLIRRNAVG